MTYTEIKGDLFDLYGKAFLAHCISADFALGKGIAKEFDRRYDVRRKLMQYQPNYMTYYKINNIKGDVIFVGSIANLITKQYYWHKPTYESLGEALGKLADICRSNNLETVAMPLIGCGLDKLSWSKVSPMIQDIFSNTNTNIIVVKQ